MPTFYNFRENGLDYSFDDVFVPADLFRDGNLWTWGYGGSGRLGNATITSASTPVTTFSGGTNWKQVYITTNLSTAIKTDGTLWTWGGSGNGRLGNGQTTGTFSTPITTFAGGTNWKQVSCGSQCVAAIKTDGTLWTWGDGSGGRLGNATITSASTPITTFAGGSNWKQVNCGSSYMTAIKTDGTLWTWGDGSGGRLGNATITSASTPITTFAGGSNWKQVNCGSSYVAAIKTDGTLWAWGSGSGGKLGNGVTTGNISTPVTTFAGGTNWKQVACGINHVVAIKTDGTLWAWGDNDSGQLGDILTALRLGDRGGSMAASSSVVTGISTTGLSIGDTLVTTDPSNIFISGSTISSIGVGSVNLSSANISAYTGVFSFARYFPPISTPITTFAGGNNWKQVSGGDYYTAAVKTNGTLWTWGASHYGQLGNGLRQGVGSVNLKRITDIRSTPVTTFAGGTNWKQVSCADDNASALTYDDPVI
jgi:hypothetical protein